MKKLVLGIFLLGILILVVGSVSAFTDNTCSGWCDAASADDFMTTSRYGDNIGTAGAWELAIKDKTSGEIVKSQENFHWTSGNWENFEVSYDPSTGEVTLTVDSKTISWTDDKEFYDHLTIIAKGKTNNNVWLDELKLNGIPLTNDALTSSNDKQGIQIYLSDSDQISGWSLTGKVKLIWDENVQDELPSFHVYSMEAYEIPPCEASIVNPLESHWYDPVNIEWEYSETCSILDQELYYHVDNCDTSSISIIEVDNSWQREHEWDVSELEDGDYCVCVYAEQRDSLLGVEGCSGIFHLDTTPPESEISFGSPNIGCNEEQEDCYVTTHTDATITCEDGEGSGPKTIYYNIYTEDGQGGWDLAHSFNEDVEGNVPAKVMFNFHEESRHKVEYWCVDVVEKVEEPHNEKIVFVDDTPPIIEKIVVGPQYAEEGSECPPRPQTNDVCHIDGETVIYANATDPDPHPVNDVYCRWEYYVDDKLHPGECGLEPPFVIQFPEESIHELRVWCWDALGNEAYDVETFYVDKTPPRTEIWHEGPYKWGSGPEQYIDGATNLSFTAVDYPVEHDSGVAETYYRYQLVKDESYCWNTSQEPWIPTDKSDQSWNLYDVPFSIEEDSCHVVEFYSVDNVDKEEEVQTWFVFVDHTPPETVKEVGEPSHDCHGLWEIIAGKCEEDWDWIITMDTEIELSCDDQGDHPSGIAGLWYRIILDGELEQDWTFVSEESTTVWFNEPSEHLLEFYCVDNVDKVSEIDSELFKVEGEEFEIELFKKWNLISIPFNLISNNIDEVFDQISSEVEVVWTYDETGWHVYSPDGPSDLTTIDPGYGYWVKMACEGYENNDVCKTLVVGGSLLSPGPGVPPSRPLQEGWNLIGHYGTSSNSAYCSLFSLVDTAIGYPRWSALYGYDAVGDVFEGINAWDNTYPGKGYWIEMDVEDMYSPATTCWGFP